MLRTSAPLVLAAALVAGCSISIQSGDGRSNKPVPPPPPPPKQQQAQQPQQGRPVVTPTPGRRKRPIIPATATRVSEPIVFGNGKAGAFIGLAYVIPETTQRVPAPGPVPFAAVLTDKFDIQPQEFTSGFPGALLQNEWFMIRYEGEFTVPKAGKWEFRLVSDDGAVLYIDDKRIIDNDGVHTAKTTDGSASLATGLHWLRLDYFQAARGQVALSVLMGQNGKLTTLTGTR